MKALKFYTQRDIRIEDIEIPKVGDDDVLVKVTDAGISQTQVNEFVEGPFLIDKVLIPSQEYGGIVVDVGKNADKNLIGKQVAILPLVSCGKCEYCLEGKENLCKEMKYHGLLGLDGGFCEYSVVNKNNIFEVEKKELLTFIEPILVGIHSANNYLSLFKSLKNKKVLILGAGAVGISVAAVYRDYFLSDVYINDLLPLRLKRAKQAGFKTLQKNELKREFDLVIDAAGMDTLVDEPAIIEGFDYLKKGEALINIGTYFHKVSFIPSSILVNEHKLLESITYNSKDVDILKDVVESINIDFNHFIEYEDFDNIIEGVYYRAEADKDSFTRLVVRIDNDKIN
jgi:(R,R)-butanediol dehydrogenase/meso-butanediol dehydrogenase/diacetyl reductase